MSEYYILNEDNVAVPVDLLTWARWFEEHTSRRIVQQDRYADGTVVSTVFLGLDHAWSKDGPRHIFETMIFSTDEHNGTTVRYATWPQALAGHAAMLAEIGREEGPR